MTEPHDQDPPRYRVPSLRYRIGPSHPESSSETSASSSTLTSPGRPVKKRPIATFALLGVILVTTAIEFALARSTDPSPAMLMAFGGMNATAVRSGEWYRLVTAALLHGGVLHILFNGVALFFGGTIVESIAGRAWLVTIAVVSAVTGSLLGMFLNNPSIVSVGASGSIMGILASGAVLAFRLPHGPMRNQLLGTLARFLIPSLLPLAAGGSGATIDYAAHIGGALGGAAVGGIVLLLHLFDHVKLSRVIATIAVSFVAASIGGAARKYPEQAADAMLDSAVVLVPNGSIPADAEEALRTVDVWGKDRPRDPRVHYARGLNAINQQKPKEAERELRVALEEKAILRKFFPDRNLETGIRAELARLLLDAGRIAEAEKEAQPVCDAGPHGTAPAALRDLGLCTKTP
jgi:rhomboid protease GluP